MTAFRWRTSLLDRLYMGICGALVGASMAFAQVQDSRFVISSDGMNVALEVQDISLREALERLFANTGIEFLWLSPSSANELISGKYNGTLSGVARQLLAQTNFVVFYKQANDEVRISRVIIVGRAKSGQTTAGLAALEAAMQPPLLVSDSGVKAPLASHSLGGVAATPPLPGGFAGRLVAPAAGDAAGQMPAPNAAAGPLRGPGGGPVISTPITPLTTTDTALGGQKMPAK